MDHITSENDADQGERLHEQYWIVGEVFGEPQNTRDRKGVAFVWENRSWVGNWLQELGEPLTLFENIYFKSCKHSLDKTR